MSRSRAMGDLGLALLSLGEVDAAERALQHVVRTSGGGELATNAMIELMYSASFRHDRVSFERWRERAGVEAAVSAPNIRSDYHMKSGVGYARFGNLRRAESELRQSYEIALAHGLHELEFRIERILGGLKECGAPDRVESAAADTAVQSDSLREVSASLAALDG